MGTAKWYMFNLHASCILLDWGFTVLSVPLLIFPAMGGYPLGILTNWFGVSTLFQVYLIMALVFVVCTSIALIFENRYYQLYAKGTRWKHFRIVFIFLNYFFTFAYNIPAVLNVPDQKMALEFTYKQIPNLPEDIKSGPIFILAIDYWLQIPFNFMAALTAGGSFTFITLLSINMNSATRRNNLSENTKRLQRKFLKAIYSQVTVFAINVLCPMSYVVISILTNYYNQMGNNLVFIIGAFHGINSTLIMLWAHKPYREVCYNLAKRAREKLKMANAVVRNNHQPTVSTTVLV
ncbi:Protein CBR-SRH-255 [Caenorhabditis briggsae]|uniref:Protein CBR-SRH-255 n=2 Tax=Caenorhabditis briggsae TaxID=6238 RepID=A8WK79_CAEBR|nr:Protein CBR-SRH-255 [Caenorhabditis briggsae]CAP20872.2 Protein CBR-SRH-255 [Caenorhabditis briggsae]